MSAKEKDRPKYAELHVGIIKTADALLKRTCAGPLHVLVWPGAPFGKALEAGGVETIDLAPFFPGGTYGPEFMIHAIDNHPNAEAARRAAKAIVDYIQKQGK